MTLGSSIITFKSLLSTFITTKPLTLDCIMFQDVSRFWHCVLCINDYYRVTVTILCLKLVSSRAGPGFRRVLARSSQPGAQRLRERLNFDVDSRHRVDTESTQSTRPSIHSPQNFLDNRLQSTSSVCIQCIQRIQMHPAKVSGFLCCH